MAKGKRNKKHKNKNKNKNSGKVEQVNMVTIEEGARFSKSKLWDAQRFFYDQKGVEAWAGDVPFYITSNPFIAYCYAKLIIRFILDCQARGAKGKFHIVELGTGSGQFSFYVLHHLHNMAKALNWKELPLCYVMTDFTQNNITFWEKNECLKQFLADGTLDFAKFDVENDETIELQQSKRTLSAETSDAPLIVIANYLFDSIVNDVFSVKEGELFESLVSLQTNENNIENNEPKDWKNVKIKHNDKPISGDYYPDKVFNTILHSYKDSVKESYINFPNGSLNGIRNLNHIANNKMLLISSDKGFVNTDELDGMEFPELDFHGSFSLMVNFHSIGEYFKHLGGDAFLQTPRDGLATGVFVNGFTWDELPQMRLVLQDSVEGFSPTDYFHIFDYLEKKKKQLDLVTISSMLSLSQWDPHVFIQLSERLMDLIEKEQNENEVIDFITNKLHLVAENFYFVPDCEDIFFSIGTIYYTLDKFQEALKYYDQSLKYFADDAEETYYNIGLCHHYEERDELALEFIKKALEVNPKNREAQRMQHEITKKIAA